MKFFLSFFCSLLSVLSVCLCPVAVFADEMGEGDNTTFTIDFVNTAPTDTISDVVAEWLDVDNSTFTYTDLAARIADAYISYQFAAPSGVASTVKEALKSALWNYIFYVDSQTGYVVGEPEFYHELDAIYSRFGFDTVAGHIGNWYPLPITYGNSTIYSDDDVYITRCVGSGGTKTLVAVRGETSTIVIGKQIASQATTSFTVNTLYSGSVYSGCYKDGLNATYNNAAGNYWTSAGLTSYTDNNVSVAVSNALTEFFGDTEEEGGHVWNGNLYYDTNIHPFTLNNLPNGTGIASDRYNNLVEDDKTPDDDISPYFNGNDTIIYRPVFEDIPNTHDFSFELPSGSMPDLDFDFNYTLAPDDNGIMTPFDEPFTYGFFAVALLALGVFLLIEVMT